MSDESTRLELSESVPFENLVDRYPEKRPEDRVYDATRIAMSIFPGGAASAELLASVFEPSIARRKDSWFRELAETVVDIQERTQDFDVRTLQENERFITAAAEASRIALGTHRKEKCRMLRNILLKVATGIDVSEDLQFMYMRLVDNLTPIHVSVLQFFWKGNSRIIAISGGNDPGYYEKTRLVDKLFPELKQDNFIIDQVIQDLRGYRLCTAEDLNASLSGNVMTNHGIGFLRFVLSDEEIAG